MISKNCAHFIIAELAVWMAGHATVALYPTLNADTVAYILEHSEARLLFVGKLDGWEEMAKGVPDALPERETRTRSHFLSSRPHHATLPPPRARAASREPCA